MPGVLDACVHEEGQGCVKIGVREHQLWGFAAEFERDRDHVLGGGGLNQAACGDRAGEGDVLNAGVFGERGARFGAEAGHDVERAGGQAGLLGEISKGERGEAGFFCRLENAGIAHRQRRADRAADDLHRVVPWYDMAGHAIGFAQCVDGVAFEIGDGFAMHLVRRAAVEFAVARQRDHVVAGLGEGFAHVERFEQGERVGVLEHKLAKTGEDAAAFHGGGGAPVALSRAVGGGDGGVDVGRGATCDGGKRGAVGRVDQVERVAGGGRHPGAVDQAEGRIEPEVRQGHVNSL